MKYLVLLVVIVSISSVCIGQNLVPNPSFEEYLECPYSTAEFQNQVIDWYSWSDSPDFFHVCSNELDGFAGVPENGFGYQFPLTGSAYAGYIGYVWFEPEIREYLAVQLTEPLEVGVEYYVMFHASLFDGGLEADSWCATNHVGLRFFKDPTYTYDTNKLEPDNFAHLDHSELLTDTMGWTKIDGWITADQAYNWLAIGNFFTGENTDVLFLNEEDRCFGTYYIENVCVATDPSYCDYLLSYTSENLTKSISVYPNPTLNSVTISSKVNPTTSIELYDLQGRLIAYKSFSNLAEVKLNLEAYKSGIYILRVHSNNMIYNEKIIRK